MSQQVIITSVTANTPVNIYYCDAMSASCVFVSTVSVFPYTFDVPSPYNLENFTVKIQDTQGCIYFETVPITPTPTPSITPSPTHTPTSTPTNTPTNTTTPTVTPTQTETPTPTPTTTIAVYPPPIPPPNIVQHQIGQSSKCCDSTNACRDTLTTQKLYNYQVDATTTPILGISIYSTYFNSNLYNPYNGNDQWVLMQWTSGNYAVQISPQGVIKDFILC
jgi:hypothetical protein